MSFISHFYLFFFQNFLGLMSYKTTMDLFTFISDLPKFDNEGKNMSRTYKISVEEKPDPDDIEFVKRKLGEYNNMFVYEARI